MSEFLCQMTQLAVAYYPGSLECDLCHNQQRSLRTCCGPGHFAGTGESGLPEDPGTEALWFAYFIDAKLSLREVKSLPDSHTDKG